LVKAEPRVAISVFPNHGVKGRVQHRAGIVAEHALGDGVVSHEVRDAVRPVASCLHDWMYVVAEVDKKPVRGPGVDQLDDV